MQPESAMHMHHAAIRLEPIGSYAAGNNRAAAAQQAAEARKRLLKSAQSIAAESDPDATLLIGHWLDSQPGRHLLDDQYHAASEDSDSDIG